MLCYKDRTFCPFWKECLNGNNCPDALTEYHIEKAKELNLYISKNLEKPDCYTEMKE
jgi:hypothetical protein